MLTVRMRPGAYFTARTAAQAIGEEIARNDTGFALRILARALAELAEMTEPDDIADCLAAPPGTGDHRWDTLIAAAFGRACQQLNIPAPRWTRAAPLAEPWFPVYNEVLEDRYRRRSPAEFAAVNVWLDASALIVV